MSISSKALHTIETLTDLTGSEKNRCITCKWIAKRLNRAGYICNRDESGRSYVHPLDEACKEWEENPHAL